LRGALATLSVLSIAGCVSVPKVDLDQRASLRSVTVLKIVEPGVVPVMNLGGPTGMFGLVGGLVQAGLNDQHTRAYTDLVKGRAVTFAPLLEDGLVASLETAGYRVARSDQKPSVQSDNRTVDYSGIKVDTDSILHAWFTTFGYVSPPNKMNFQPWVGVRVRVVDSASKKDLYFKTFVCGYEPKLEGAVAIPVDAQYEYESYDKLAERLDHSVAGLRECEQSIVATVARDVKPR
jgi:hypothetical protein